MCRQSQHKELLTIDQVPRFLRYNYYIRSGYRHPPDSYTSSAYHLIVSTFSWHNESVNIWTHLFGLIVFAFLMIYEVLFRSSHIRWWVMCTCFACVVTFFGSIMYHSGMNKCKCQSEYNKCLNYDVMGVLFSSTFSGMSPVINGYKCNYNIFVYISIILLICSMTYSSIKILHDKATAAIRGKYIALHALLRTVLALSMVCGNMIWHARNETMKWHGVSLILLIVGGAINVSRYPEKLFVNKYVSSIFLINRDRLKRKLKNGQEDSIIKEEYHKLLDIIRYSIDYIGNSHQIWHVFVVLSCFTVYYGCVWDDLYLQNTLCANDDLYDLAKREMVEEQIMMNNVESDVQDKSAIYKAAMELIFEPSFLYPF